MTLDTKMKELLDLMMAKQYRKANQAASKRKTPNRIDPFWEACQAYNRQTKCSHLKGMRSNNKPIGDKLPFGYNRDYNVAMHTFVNASQKIWCMCGCGWHVWNTPEYRFKWQVGMKMVKSSTNYPSQAQVPGEFYQVKRDRK